MFKLMAGLYSNYIYSQSDGLRDTTRDSDIQYTVGRTQITVTVSKNALV